MDEVAFSITSYKGHEHDVLRLRNNNRANPQTSIYMNWRYLGEKSPYPPLICWATSQNKQVGMAAIVFRPYWVDQKLHYFAVLGDISVDANMRGKGMGKNLLRYVTLFLKEQSYYCALVIPNEPVKKTLLSEGWITPESFVWYVWTVDPVPKLNEYIKPRLLVNILDVVYRLYTWIKLNSITAADIELRKTDVFDESFDEFWRKYKKDGIIRDRSARSLRWRYQEHPNKKYETRKVFSRGDLVGYIIYEFENGNTCFIADFLTLDVKYTRPAIKLFIDEICKTRHIHSIRYKLNENHHYGADLVKFGFRKRHDNDVFQVLMLNTSNTSGSRKWYVSRGDKDT